jgi:hypothetical protein
MGLFSSLFRPTEYATQRLAAHCVFLRDEHQFLQEYANTRVSSSSELTRLQFSKDVLMLILAAQATTLYLRDQRQLVQTVESFRRIYLGLISVPPTSVVGECLVCEDELKAVGSIVAPNAPLSQVRTTLVSTKRFISLVVDCRSSEFNREMIRGCLESASSAAMLPLGHTCLWRIRGGSKDEISFDDVNHFAVAFTIPYTSICIEAQRLFE